MRWIALFVALQISIAHAQPDQVPGNSIANKVPSIMSMMWELALGLSQKLASCSEPAIENTKVVEFSPWDTSVSPPVLTGDIVENWFLDACGTRVRVILVVAPVADGSGRFVISSAGHLMEQ